MTYYDSLETRSPVEREAWLMARLPQQLALARRKSAYWRQRLADVAVNSIGSRAALATLPLLRKSKLGELQCAAPPFGGLTATPMTGLSRVFASPGPIYDPEGQGQDWWRFARALFAAGFRAGDLVHNTFSYHFTPAGFMLEGAAHKLGCPVFPAGVGQTDMQVQAIADLKPAAYVGTPSFLRTILEKADELGADVSSLRKAVVSGEALPATLRKLLNDRGVVVRQAYASADLGLIAYETPSEEGLVVEEDVLLEIVRPGTGDPVAEGEVGEVVVTSFNADYPLIRFATGDLSALLPGISPCGRTNVRIRGWLGRADQATKVKGMFVHPSQVAALVARHGEIGRARLVVDNPSGHDRMTLHCEVADPSAALQAAVVASIRELTKLRGEVAFLPAGTLANDGTVIEDRRSYA
ncbi:MAG: AMP-binding protein [Candidatus Accumulibacter sp.]|jgi:phenylacetate-CoA ligase|uniref:phenylacetate--CoA ligase family protein n=1 Tax=unclassified Candidatus Accumulibacter TaxID=2619054 RepID=UPI001A392B2F|nr:MULTISPECIES: AMP-binding protein [unclassified Candidatus Accumulibacter]MBL8368502.1 AMP-binding protein [Accumulibacter sp.]HRI91487.1 AMP-binding protein [Accumulibacter sp.]